VIPADQPDKRESPTMQIIRPEASKPVVIATERIAVIASKPIPVVIVTVAR
jgi:hypothetical protein